MKKMIGIVLLAYLGVSSFAQDKMIEYPKDKLNENPPPHTPNKNNTKKDLRALKRDIVKENTREKLNSLKKDIKKK